MLTVGVTIRYPPPPLHIGCVCVCVVCARACPHSMYVEEWEVE